MREEWNKKKKRRKRKNGNISDKKKEKTKKLMKTIIMADADYKINTWELSEKR